MVDLVGKRALITGAARGHGATAARLFVESGARVLIADVRDELGRAVAAELGEAAQYVHLDVTSERCWTDVVDLVDARFGGLDVLVNNAGILRADPLETMSLEDYQAVIAVNQVGCFLGMRAVVPAMRNAGGGSIINISSVAGLKGVAGAIGYVASKWAVRGMTKTAALELGAYGIRVNSVHPGAVDTEMIGGPDFADVDRDAHFRGLPIPRIGQPEEVARMVAFLASDDSSYSTGSEFLVDGGDAAGGYRVAQ